MECYYLYPGHSCELGDAYDGDADEARVPFGTRVRRQGSGSGLHGHMCTHLAIAGGPQGRRVTEGSAEQAARPVCHARAPCADGLHPSSRGR